ncbi:MAG: response regulator transcription factor [Proteobacteria bacterium]|nr:response regulator transcription factor [Pseudomonadota bacterium]
MRLLLIEDHQRFANFVKEGLEKEGFTVDTVATAATGEAAQSTVQYDAIILDLGLPDQDGLELLRSWREDGSKTPVLILTARDGVDERVKGLNSGGDDYLLKPFAMEELVARIRALLRRPGGVLGLVITTGNVSFDTTAREVRINEKTISIPRREMGVLEHLMRRNGRVVPKVVLEDKIYGFGKEVSSNSVEVHVSRLRKRLSVADANITVHTLRGVGYLLSEEDTLTSQEPSS